MSDERMNNGTGANGANEKGSAELEALRAEVAMLRRQQDERHVPFGGLSTQQVMAQGEIEHSARNTMALVRSIFRRTAEGGVTTEELAMHFTGRLDVLARYLLPRSIGVHGNVDLEGLVRDEFHDFQFGDMPGIEIAGPDVALSSYQSQSFALAIHELVTNALKFGALSTQGARLSVTWGVTDDRLELTWAETGVSIVSSAPITKGLGREFIEEALPYQIGAITSFEVRPGGIIVQIALPLATQKPNDGADTNY